MFHRLNEQRDLKTKKRIISGLNGCLIRDKAAIDLLSWASWKWLTSFDWKLKTFVIKKTEQTSGVECCMVRVNPDTVQFWTQNIQTRSCSEPETNITPIWTQNIQTLSQPDVLQSEPKIFKPDILSIWIQIFKPNILSIWTQNIQTRAFRK